MLALIKRIRRNNSICYLIATSLILCLASFANMSRSKNFTKSAITPVMHASFRICRNLMGLHVYC